MATVTIVLRAEPAQVRRVLDDPWRYADWVVGAERIRAADERWPAPGARFHHTVGAGPVVLHDHTELLERTDTRWELDARAWPAGRARVRLTLAHEGAWCRVTMAEAAVSGPGSWPPDALLAPLLRARNRVALRRLRTLVERERATAGAVRATWRSRTSPRSPRGVTHRG